MRSMKTTYRGATFHLIAFLLQKIFLVRRDPVSRVSSQSLLALESTSSPTGSCRLRVHSRPSDMTPPPPMDKGPLGQKVDAPDVYSPEVLFPVPRTMGRSLLGLSDNSGSLPFAGEDAVSYTHLTLPTKRIV